MQQGDDAWLRQRLRCAATCSEYGEALGVGYGDPVTYMQRKWQVLPPVEPNWMMQQGTKYEPWICGLYYRLMYDAGARIRMDTNAFEHDPWDIRLGGSVDRLVTDLHTGERYVLECKMGFSAVPRTTVPVTHLLQMLGLCHVHGVGKAHYVCWQRNVAVFVAEVTFDDDLWNRVYDRLRVFADHWAAGTLPVKLTARERHDFVEEILVRCHVHAVPCLRTKALAQPLLQTDQGSTSFESPEFACFDEQQMERTD